MHLRRSGKRKVLLPKPKKVFSSSTSPITPSHHHASSQGIPITTSTVASSATAAPPVQSPYVITQNTGASFTSSTHFPAPPIPVQNTVIVQQGGQSVYVQQQVRCVHVYVHVHVHVHAHTLYMSCVCVSHVCMCVCSVMCHLFPPSPTRCTEMGVRPPSCPLTTCLPHNPS